MNIPARYGTGYLGDIGVPADPNPMDFSAWFEAYLGGHWHTFDARHRDRRQLVRKSSCNPEGREDFQWFLTVSKVASRFSF
jgi:transglutaminase-like putative cysteine protease